MTRPKTFDPRPISELDHWLRERNKAEQQIARLVKVARKDGAPWQVIGQALNMTKQAAQQRYGRAPR